MKYFILALIIISFSCSENKKIDLTIENSLSSTDGGLNSTDGGSSGVIIPGGTIEVIIEPTITDGESIGNGNPGLESTNQSDTGGNGDSGSNISEIEDGPSNISEIEDGGGGSNNNSIKIKFFNYFIISAFLLFISFYLLQLSGESWLYFKWFRNNDLKLNRLNYINTEIEKLNNLINLSSSNNFDKNKMRHLDDELNSYTRERNKLDESIYSLEEFSFTQIAYLNSIFYLVSILFFAFYLFTCLIIKNNIGYYDRFDLFLSELSIFTFPTLVIASFFSLLSLFRFILTQGSYRENSKNRMSFFGIIVSLITVTGALLSIYKFIY